jgi:hypothetical protein
MKKIIALALVLILAAGLASAETFTTIHDFQQKFMLTAPIWLQGTGLKCDYTGTVMGYYDADGWYVYTVGVKDATADNALVYGYDCPCFMTISAYKLEPGTVIHVTGDLQVQFSSSIVPFVYPADVKVIANAQN